MKCACADVDGHVPLSISILPSWSLRSVFCISTLFRARSETMSFRHDVARCFCAVNVETDTLLEYIVHKREKLHFFSSIQVARQMVFLSFQRDVGVLDGVHLV